MDDTPSSPWPRRFTVLMIAFAALWAEQVTHESTHALFTIITGKDLEWLSFWASSGSWPEGAEPDSDVPTYLITGSAAVVNILCAIGCMVAFRARATHDKPRLRLFLYFFAAYSLFAGFGYLAFDPIFANEDSAGDWAKITMLLGGSWGVRLPLMAIGFAGTVFGYFWMGQAALRFRCHPEAETGDSDEARKARIKVGLLITIFPFVAINCLFMVFALFHPLGLGGTIMAAIKVWGAFSGFFWAHMINFEWRPQKIHEDLTVLDFDRHSPALLGTTAVLLALTGLLLATPFL